MRTIVVCSCGLDSVTLAHPVARDHELAGLVSFDDGQRHRRELECAAAAAARLGVPHHRIDITAIGAHLTGSAPTDDIDVPDGHYAEETMKATVVPNRNAIMLTIAFGLAAAQRRDAVAVAVHGGGHFVYPDGRPDVIRAFQAMQDRALDGYAEVRLYAPYVERTKADIVTDGADNGTPFAQTWSCYTGGRNQCGRCGTCAEGREAFHLAKIADPTRYDDADVWREIRRGAPSDVRATDIR